MSLSKIILADDILKMSARDFKDLARENKNSSAALERKIGSRRDIILLMECSDFLEPKEKKRYQKAEAEIAKLLDDMSGVVLQRMEIEEALQKWFGGVKV